MEPDDVVREILASDRLRLRALDAVRSLRLPDSWIGAGFVRNAVWDRLHGREVRPPNGDVDVLWFAPRVDKAEDRRLEARLKALEPSLAWSVKNQARMHDHNGDAPYASTTDAMRWWPDTATAVAARRGHDGRCEIAAPFGLADLLGLVVRPGPAFVGDRQPIFADRVRTKRWLELWPRLRVLDVHPAASSERPSSLR